MGTRGPSARDWSEMPFDALTSVFAKLGAVELLMGAGLVCRSWLEAAKAPELWRAVVMMCHRPKVKGGGASLCAMAKVALYRSGWRLEKFVGREFVTDELLKYIADRSPSLKSLGLIECSDISEKGFMNLIIKFPQLEELVLTECQNVFDDDKESRDVYEAIGRACPQLKLFMLCHEGYLLDEFGNHTESGDAHGIATMKQLRHLSLGCINITNEELVTIINSCPHLEHLCMRDCYNIVVDDELRAKCARIKTLKLKPYQEHPFGSAECSADPSQDRHSDPDECFCADEFFDDTSSPVGMYRCSEEMVLWGPSIRDWSGIPFDALTCVFSKLCTVELLMGAGVVCRSWLEAAKAPELWRDVVMTHQHHKAKGGGALRAMAKAAVDRSSGRLKKFVGSNFMTDELLEYTADRSPSLKSLGLIKCSDISEKGFMDLIIKFPQLEELVLTECQNVCDDDKESRDVYEAIGRACPQLQLFILCHEGYLLDEDGNHSESGDALGIATMKQLRHLRLDCINITNEELLTIIDSCPYLEHLCMRDCYNIVIDDALRAKCARIKTLKLKPYHDHPLGSADTNKDRHSDPDECCCADEFQATEIDYSSDK